MCLKLQLDTSTKSLVLQETNSFESLLLKLQNETDYIDEDDIERVLNTDLLQIQIHRNISDMSLIYDIPDLNTDLFSRSSISSCD